MNQIRLLQSGDLLHDRYRIENILGRGGFGITYKAVDMTVNVPVAVKQYVSAEKKDLDDALHEAQIAAGFYDLDGIAAARDFFMEEGSAYIVMSYVRGMSLRHYVEKYGHFEGREALGRFERIIQSLITIHSKGYIHRDISADNVLISPEGKLTLIDFGAAKYTQTSQNETNTVVFKRGFAPIEQCRAGGRQGTYTDVYSVCATLYFMMTGMVPDDAVERILDDRLKPLSEIYGTGLGEREEQAIMRGLSVEPEERFSSVSELYQELYSQDQRKRDMPLFDTEQMTSYEERERRKSGNEPGTLTVFQSIKKFVKEKSVKKYIQRGVIPGILILAFVVFFYVQGKESSQPAAVSGGSVSATAVKSSPKPEETEQVTASTEESSTETPVNTATPKENKSKKNSTKKVTATPKTKAEKTVTATPKIKKKATATPKITATPKAGTKSGKKADDFAGDLDELGE